MRRLKLRIVAIVAALIPLSFLSIVVNPARAEQPARYHVMNLESLGGTTSAGNSINDRGWISGASNLSGDQTTHATLWVGEAAIDLGTLGGPNSAVLWPVQDEAAPVVGVAANSG